MLYPGRLFLIESVDSFFGWHCMYCIDTYSSLYLTVLFDVTCKLAAGVIILTAFASLA